MLIFMYHSYIKVRKYNDTPSFFFNLPWQVLISIPSYHLRGRLFRLYHQNLLFPHLLYHRLCLVALSHSSYSIRRLNIIAMYLPMYHTENYERVGGIFLKTKAEPYKSQATQIHVVKLMCMMCCW